jgi:5,5'-dehydrodivanillate O-demethylase
MGPLPAPELPEYDPFTMPGAIRAVGKWLIPCNWLQCMENSADPVHTEWLHGALTEFVHEKDDKRKSAMRRKHEKIDFSETPYGLVKRRLYAGQSEDSQDWTVGHPIMFPNMLLTGNSGQWQQRSVQIRVPVDDENTMHYWFSVYVPPQGAKIPQHLLDRVPVYEPTIRYPDGRWNLDVTDGQDIMVWVDQGKIADRTKETLGASDKGITFYRRMLLREMERAEQGHDPLGTIRDPKAVHVPLPVEQGKQIHADGFRTVTARNAVSFSPIYEELVSVFEQAMPDKMGAFKGLPETAAAE